jgi:hypothetical protein
MKSFLLYLYDECVEDFIKNIDVLENDPALLHKNYPNFFDTKKDASAKMTILAIRKRIRHLIDEGKGLHSSKSKLVEDVCGYLKSGKTVIIDLSLKDNLDANIISTILVRKLFNKIKKCSHLGILLP